MDARSAQFQEHLQEKNDEIKRLWEQLRVRIQKHLYYSFKYMICTAAKLVYVP